MVAKAYHKHVRRKAIPHLQEYAVDSQCGGLKSRATDIAALAVRAFLDKCKAQGRSAATLFLDIKAAFDSAMRELLLPMNDPVHCRVCLAARPDNGHFAVWVVTCPLEFGVHVGFEAV